MQLKMDIIEQTLASLKKNRIQAQYLESEKEVFSVIDHFIVPGAVIGAGDSETLSQLDIYNYVRRSESVFLDKYDPSLTKEEKRELYIKNFSADVFISGLNALTTGGKIFNLDGNGSRVAPMIYGPKKVLLLCGTNKIVTSDEAAVMRIKTIAAPRDAQRLKKNTPCRYSGTCQNCSSPEKICNYYTVIQGQFDTDRITVLIVGGSYGF